MKRNLIILGFIGVSLTACGSDGPKLTGEIPTAASMTATAPAQAPGGKAAQQAPKAGPKGDINQPNPHFSIIRSFFFTYLKRPIDTKVDIFKANLASFAPTIEIEAEAEATEVQAGTPLQFYDIDSYKLVLIMSGTATSKALVIDPQDKSYVVQVGTPIGNRNGKVISISGGEVRVDEPGYPPIVKSLQSDDENMIRELQSVQEF